MILTKPCEGKIRAVGGNRSIGIERGTYAMGSSSKSLILVADDDPNVLKAMQFRLEELGYRVHCVPDKLRMLG